MTRRMRSVPASAPMGISTAPACSTICEIGSPPTNPRLTLNPCMVRSPARMPWAKRQRAPISCQTN